MGHKLMAVFGVAAVAALASGCGSSTPGSSIASPSSIPTSQPDTGFCSTHSCIANFDKGNGYIVQCRDGKWSHSGGVRGACSDNGGESSTCADESGNTITCPQQPTTTENARPPTTTTSESVPSNDQGTPPANTSPPMATVPDVRGEQANSAMSALQAAGFAVNQTTKNMTNRANDGVVLSQDPSGNSTANKGSTVTIVVGHFQPSGVTTTTTTTTTP